MCDQCRGERGGNLWQRKRPDRKLFIQVVAKSTARAPGGEPLAEEQRADDAGNEQEVVERKARYRTNQAGPTSAWNTRLTSAWVSRRRASSVEKSGVSPARAITRRRSSPEVSGLNLPLTQSRRICVRS